MEYISAEVIVRLSEKMIIFPYIIMFILLGLTSDFKEVLGSIIVQWSDYTSNCYLQ